MLLLRRTHIRGYALQFSFEHILIELRDRCFLGCAFIDTFKPIFALSNPKLSTTFQRLRFKLLGRSLLEKVRAWPRIKEINLLPVRVLLHRRAIVLDCLNINFLRFDLGSWLCSTLQSRLRIKVKILSLIWGSEERQCVVSFIFAPPRPIISSL